MIEAKDVEFHPSPDPKEFRWAETNYFPFNLPEVGINGAIYCLFRPNLGVVMSDITIFDKIARNWEGLAYVDNQQHLPCPDKLSDYSLENGVSVKVLDGAPQNYQVDYVGIDDTEVHFEFRGIMRPQDIADPDQDPQTRKKLAQSGDDAWDGAFGGHFEMTARSRGELILRGKRYPIDALGTMDHSWGPRAERDNTNAVWLQAHFGDDLVLHALGHIDPREPDGVGPIWHGYALKDGEVRGLVGGSGRAHRQGMFPAGVELKLEDEQGDSYELSGYPITWGPWAPYPSLVYNQGLTRWNLNGRIGYGPFQEVMSRAFLTRHDVAE